MCVYGEANPMCLRNVCIKNACNGCPQCGACKGTREHKILRPGSWWSMSEDRSLNSRRGEKVKFNVPQGQVALECVKVETVQWSTSSLTSATHSPIHLSLQISSLTTPPPKRWQTLAVPWKKQNDLYNNYVTEASMETSANQWLLKYWNVPSPTPPYKVERGDL